MNKIQPRSEASAEHMVALVPIAQAISGRFSMGINPVQDVDYPDS